MSDTPDARQTGGAGRTDAKGSVPLWSPAQFSFGASLVVVTVASGYCGLLRLVGARAFFPVLLGALALWFGYLVYQLTQLSPAASKAAHEGERQAHGPDESADDDLLARLAPLAATTKYPIDAYLLVLEALVLGQKRVKHPRSESSHISAADLCWQVRDVALAEYGGKATARAGLASLGIESCGHLGEIVATLIAAGLIGDSPEDRPEDFAPVFDFDREFGSEES